ncbi:hypothetical protein BGX28_004778 [Mortierella sp. GBA30]|nr:hypothetical protein BGX28_004778 [Mortierella sp. GBA30]
MADSTTVFCVIESKSIFEAFPVNIALKDTVGDLKDAIKAKKAVEFNGVDADKLTLNLTSIPVKDTNKYDAVRLDQASQKDLLPTTRLREIFHWQSPSDDTIHIIVQRPSPVRDVSEVSTIISRLRVFVLMYSRKEFTWTVDPQKATLSGLRTAVKYMFSVDLAASDKIVIQHGEDASSREPVLDDSQLQTILVFNIRAGIKHLIVDLQTTSGNLHGLAFQRGPTSINPPLLEPTQRLSTDFPSYFQALERLLTCLDSGLKSTLVTEDNKYTLLIEPFLIEAITVFGDRFRPGTYLLSSFSGTSPHYAIQSQDGSRHILAVTTVERQDFARGVISNEGILESIARNQRSNRRYDRNPAIDMVTYGIVTNANEWRFTECRLKSNTDEEPTFRTSRLPESVVYTSEDEVWQNQASDVFEYVVWLLKTIVDRAPQGK